MGQQVLKCMWTDIADGTTTIFTSILDNTHNFEGTINIWQPSGDSPRETLQGVGL